MPGGGGCYMWWAKPSEPQRRWRTELSLREHFSSGGLGGGGGEEEPPLLLLPPASRRWDHGLGWGGGGGLPLVQGLKHHPSGQGALEKRL